MEEIQGKVIVDAAGNEVGKVDDIEVYWEGKTIEAIVVKGKGLLAKQFSSERLDALFKKLRITKTDDLLIPLEEIQAIGKFVVLKKKLELEAKK
jgi:sporulation protein YlmC with PRC-barrel domain